MVVYKSKNWPTPNQWRGLHDQAQRGDSGINMIMGSTSNTLTLSVIAGGYNNNTPIVWEAGNRYVIHKALITIDQPGRGKGDRGRWAGITNHRRR